MTRQSIWQVTADEYADWVPKDLQNRYASALDTLAEYIVTSLWDCDAGIWRSPSGDEQRRRMSLGYLGKILVLECEKFRLRPRETATVHNNRGSAAHRRAIAKKLSHVITFLKRGDSDAIAATVTANEHLKPVSSKPPPVGLTSPAQHDLWWSLPPTLSPATLAAALSAMVATLEYTDHRAQPRGRHEAVETALSRALVNMLRTATGASTDYQIGGLTSGGKPLYRIATQFVVTAGWTMTPETMKSRLEATPHA